MKFVDQQWISWQGNSGVPQFQQKTTLIACISNCESIVNK